jgi:hypothetical protein
MCYIKSPSSTSASKLETLGSLFNGYMIASKAKELDELFLAIRKAPSRQP